jgi:hypothetical protein
MDIKIELVSPKPIYTRRKGSTNTTCRKCSKTLDRQGQLCIECSGRYRVDGSIGNYRRKILRCGFEGCKEHRIRNKHSCEYHSVENRRKRYMNEDVFCNTCGEVLGKRKDYIYGSRTCNKCREVKEEKLRIKRLEYSREYYRNRYNTDEEYRTRMVKYQKKWRDKKKRI